jgi:hypothetical protein
VNNISPTAIALMFIVCVVSGGISGYFAASYTPVPQQIAIVDVSSLVMRSFDKDKPQTEEEAKALTAKVKATTSKLVEQGIVVLDAQSVIDAPLEAYVNVE